MFFHKLHNLTTEVYNLRRRILRNPICGGFPPLPPYLNRVVGAEPVSHSRGETRRAPSSTGRRQAPRHRARDDAESLTTHHMTEGRARERGGEKTQQGEDRKGGTEREKLSSRLVRGGVHASPARLDSARLSGGLTHRTMMPPQVFGQWRGETRGLGCGDRGNRWGGAPLPAQTGEA